MAAIVSVWFPKRLERLIELASRRPRPLFKDIAKELGVTKGAVSGKVGDLTKANILQIYRESTDISAEWPEELITELLRLDALVPKLNARDIGARLGRTRSAVIGKLQRIKDRQDKLSKQTKQAILGEEVVEVVRFKDSNAWTESRLTETWEDRKRRRALEKERAQYKLQTNASCSKVSAATRSMDS